MDVGQLAAQAVRDLTTRLSGGTSRSETGSFALPDSDPLFATFAQLGTVDGWGKLAYQRVRKNPGDAVAVADLRCSLEQAARLHPRVASQLQLALGERVAQIAVTDTMERLPSPR